MFRRRRWFQGRGIRGLDDLVWFRPDGEEMTDDDWENGYARAVGVFLNGDAIPTPGRLRWPDRRRHVLRDVQRQRARPAVDPPRASRGAATGPSSSTPTGTHEAGRRRAGRRDRPRRPLDGRAAGRIGELSDRGGRARRSAPAAPTSSASRRSTGTSRATFHETAPSTLRDRRRGARGRRRPTAAGRLPPVVLGAGAGRTSVPASTDAELRLADGTELAAHVSTTADRGAPRPAARLPRARDRPATGVRRDGDRRRRPDRDARRRSAVRRGRAVRARPTRCGSATARDRRSPTSPRSPPTLPAQGIDVLVTLPLYAGFLDEPFDPSPYAPVSRLHWNEVYLDDATCPAADDRRSRTGELDRLARRGAPPPAAAAGRRPRRRRPGSIPAAVARFAADASRRRRLRPLPRRAPRPRRRRQPGRARRGQPRARPVPRRPPAGARRGPRPGRARPRPADRQPPDGLRDVGRSRAVRHDRGRRRAARLVLRRGSELGVPAAAPRRHAAQRPSPVARPRRPRRPPRVGAARSTT